MRQQRPRFSKKIGRQQFFLKGGGESQKHRLRFARPCPENLVVLPVTELVDPDRDRGEFNAGSKLKQFRLATLGNIAQEGQGQMERILVKQTPASTIDHPIGDAVQGTSHPGGKPERKEKSRRPGAFGFNRHDPSSPSFHSVHLHPNSSFSASDSILPKKTTALTDPRSNEKCLAHDID